jgi:hypothetical protein
MSKDRFSGQEPFAFAYRDDLHTLPDFVRDAEVDLHGTFADDRRDGFGEVYYGMPGKGILRIDSDLKSQELIKLPNNLAPLNFHSTELGTIEGKERLFLSANGDEMVAVITLEGEIDFILPRPEFEAYQDEEAPFNPTDSVLVGNTLYVADGYGSNYISTADVISQSWTETFGGKAEFPEENGKFSTAHGLDRSPVRLDRLVIADRPSARIQEHGFNGHFHHSHSLPSGAWPCGIDHIKHQDRWLAVVGSLNDPEEGRPAPIYLLDGTTYEVLSTIRPKDELGVGLAQHLHNVAFHVAQGRLYLICQAWNPGYYFVLEQV